VKSGYLLNLGVSNYFGIFASLLEEKSELENVQWNQGK
jgi:hypothetical protein